MYSAVIYTDGSGRNSLASYGFFYYIYKIPTNEENEKKTPIVSIGDCKAEFTDLGLLTPVLKLENQEYYKSAVNVKPEYVFSGRRNVNGATNNYMELLAILDSLNHINEKSKELDLELKEVLVKTDSQVSISRISNILLGKPTDSPFQEEIKQVYNDLSSRKCKVSMTHVYGHASSFGNMLVDRLAYSCGERNEEFKEVLDITSTYNKKLEFPWYIFGTKFHVMAAETPTLFLDRYDKKEVVGEKRGGTIVGIVKPKEFAEPIKSMYEKYMKIGDDSVIDIKFDLNDIKSKDNTLFYHCCGTDAYDVNPKNDRWFRICGKNVAMTGGNMAGLGMILYNKLDGLFSRYKEDIALHKIDMKPFFNKKNLKDKGKIDIAVNLSDMNELCGIEVTEQIRNGLKKLKHVPVFPSLNIPNAKFISTVLLDNESKIELVICNVTEVLLNAFVYIKSDKYEFESIWSDSEIDTIFLK